jgi:hypothetical protein
VNSQFTKILWSINKDEIDMLNVLINIIERYDSFDPETPFDYTALSYLIDTNMHELCAMLGFKELKSEYINQTLESLASKIATLYFEDGEDRIMKKGPFVLDYIISSSKKDLNKRIQISVNTKIVKVFRDDKKMFELFYRFDKYGLRSKYSKILYEMFGKKPQTSLKVSIEDFIDELEYDITETKNKSWSRLNSNILKRAVGELEDKSNLIVNYAKIKSKDEKDNRVKTSMIQIEASASPEMEEPDIYFTNDFLMPRKIDYYLEREVEKKYNDASRFGTLSVRDEEAYKAKMRRELKKFHKEHEAKVLLQEWINIVKYANPDMHGLVSLFEFQGYEAVTVNNNYVLVDVETKKPLSTNAIDSREKIKRFINDEDGDYGIVDTDGSIKDCSVSYTKG